MTFASFQILRPEEDEQKCAGLLEVDSLSPILIDLLYHLALGYREFTYFEKLKCWKVERSAEGSRLTHVGLIPDEGCNLINHPCYARHLNDYKYVLSEMSKENICLEWTRSPKKVKLFYGAFPEISAVDDSLQQAFKKVFIKKEFGDIISEHEIYCVNSNKHKISMADSFI